MLKKILYQHSEELYKFQFLEEKDNNKIIIAPSPLIADKIRKKLSDNKASILNFEVVTISNFNNKLFQKFETLKQFQIERKVELLKKLAVGYKYFEKEIGFEKFLRAYNIFTDIRSFTLDQQVTEKVLEEHDPELKKIVLIFNKLIEAQDIVDEHRAYFLIAEQLRSPIDFPVEAQDIIFIGFNFFSGSQIDYIKALAIRQNVYIPIHKKVDDLSTNFDWPKWLSDLKIVNLDYKNTNNKKIDLKCIKFPKNKMTEVINQKLNHLEVAEVFLGARNPRLEDFLEISLSNTNFKVNINFLEEEIKQFAKAIEQKFFLKNDQEIEVEKFIGEINNWMTKKLINIDNKKNFKVLKLQSMVTNFLKDWFSLSDLNTNIQFFDFQLMIECLNLSSPRNSIVGIAEENDVVSISNLNLVDFYKSEIPTIITAKIGYDGLVANRPKSSIELEKILSSIGPVRRSEFDFLQLQMKLDEILELPKTILIIEENLNEHDLNWSRILEKYTLTEFQSVHENEKENRVVSYNFLNASQKYIHSILSPTRLQTYIDCPKSFYFKYVDSTLPNISLKETLQMNDLGTLQHKLIEEFFKKDCKFEDQEIHLLAKNIFDQFLAVNNKKISTIDYGAYLGEIESFGKNGIEFLFHLKQFNQELNYNFELELKDSVSTKNRQGRVDFLADSAKMFGLIDFKRSQASIPSQKKLLTYEKIQVWFYLNLLADLKIYSPEKEFIVGYLNLSEIEKSLLIVTESTREKFENNDYFKDFRMVEFNEKWQSAYLEYKNVEDEIFKKLSNDELFPINPRHESACKYCSLNNICPKTEVNYASQ